MVEEMLIFLGTSDAYVRSSSNFFKLHLLHM